MPAPADSSNPQKISTTILQYIQTIERLTNMSNDKEFYEIIDSKEAYEAYKKIISLDYRKYKIKTLLDDIKEGMGNNLNWESAGNFDNGGRESGMDADLSENPKVKLCVIFEETNYKKLFIGIYSEELDENVKKKLYDNLFEKDKEWKSVNSWVAWKYWSKGDVIEDLCLGSEAEKKQKLIELIEELKKLETAWMKINNVSES